MILNNQIKCIYRRKKLMIHHIANQLLKIRKNNLKIYLINPFKIITITIIMILQMQHKSEYVYNIFKIKLYN